MTSYFVDTNVFLRHLLNDDPTLSSAAREIILAIEQGHLTAWTSDLVIAELVFVLSSKQLYSHTAEAIAAQLLPLIRLPNLKLMHKQVYDRAFELYIDRRIDFIDAYNAALMEQRGELHIFSFDTDFDQVIGIGRHESLPHGQT